VSVRNACALDIWSQIIKSFSFRLSVRLHFYEDNDDLHDEELQDQVEHQTQRLSFSIHNDAEFVQQAYDSSGTAEPLS
jgi:hypothetical protein